MSSTAATFLLGLGLFPAARRSVSVYPANGSSENIGAVVVSKAAVISVRRSESAIEATMHGRT